VEAVLETGDSSNAAGRTDSQRSRWRTTSPYRRPDAYSFIEM